MEILLKQRIFILYMYLKYNKTKLIHKHYKMIAYDIYCPLVMHENDILKPNEIFQVLMFKNANKGQGNVNAMLSFHSSRRQ